MTLRWTPLLTIFYRWERKGAKSLTSLLRVIKQWVRSWGLNLAADGREARRRPPQCSRLEGPTGEAPGALPSMGPLTVGQDWAASRSLFTFMHWRRQWQPTPVLLPGESQGRGSLVGCRLWGRTESDTTEATKQQQQQQLTADCRLEDTRLCHLSALLHQVICSFK